MRGLGLARISSFYVALVALGAALLWARGALGSAVPRGVGPWLLAVGLGLGVGLALVGLSRAFIARFAWARDLAADLRGVVGELGRGEALVVAALSGLGEELVFRGALQPIAGLWLTSLLFGSLHVGPTRRSAPWALMAAGAGLIFGAMGLWTGDLVAPILAHGTVNFLNLRFLSLADRRPFVTLGPVDDGETVV